MADLQAINDIVPYARTVGLELLRDEQGLLTVLRFRESNIGNFVVRTIHGGVIGGLLEHAAIMHLLVETDISVVPRIINVSIDYLRPCRAEDTSPAAASSARVGRSPTSASPPGRTNPLASSPPRTRTSC